MTSAIHTGPLRARDPIEEIKGTIAAYDGAGTLFRWYETELAVYEDGDCDPLFRFVTIASADELRHLVEGYRAGLIAGERTGRALQKLELQRALGVVPDKEVDRT